MRSSCFLQVVFLCNFGRMLHVTSQPPVADADSPSMEQARSVWKLFQDKCCRGFDDIEDSDLMHSSTCAALDLDTDYSHLKGVSVSSRKNSESVRILYLMTSAEIFEAVERSNVNEYAGMCQNDAVDSVMWGIGFQGFNPLESLDENIRRWFTDTHFDVIHSSHLFYRAVSSALHGVGGINLMDNAFEFSSTSLTSRASELEPLRTSSMITIAFNELGDREIEDIYVLRPDVLFIAYEQQLGAGGGGGHLAMAGASTVAGSRMTGAL
jgi:hypothetical protein